jgi:hypothetical protein
MCDLHRKLSIEDDVTDGAWNTHDEIKNIYGILVRKPYTKYHLGFLDTDDKIILQLVLDE